MRRGEIQNAYESASKGNAQKIVNRARLKPIPIKVKGILLALICSELIKLRFKCHNQLLVSLRIYHFEACNLSGVSGQAYIEISITLVF